jgi:hypothetical protein
MKTFYVTSALLAAAAGFAFAALDGGDECAAQKAKAAECAAVADGEKGECPATGLIARWEKASEQMAALPAATLEKLASARATLAGACPVCEEAPTSFAFLGEFFATNAAFDEAVLECCGEECEEGSEGEIPAEIVSAWKERTAIGGRANHLFQVFARATSPGEPSAKEGECEAKAAKSECCAEGEAKECCQGEKLTIASAATTFEGISKRASEIAERWNGVPARAAAIPAEKKAELRAAMAVFTKETPFCDLSKETMALLATGLERCVALDEKLSEHCEASAKECPVTGEAPAEAVAMKKAAQARAEATKKVASLLRTMGKVMTPEIFEAAPAVEVAGGGN